jgi:hypothetical protein
MGGLRRPGLWHAGVWGARVWGLLGVLVLLGTGCDFVDEILNMRPVGVVDYYPPPGTVAPEAVASVWVEFSAEMDQSQAESAFSLTENGKVLEGRFAWSAGGRRLSFIPVTLVRRARRYDVRVTTVAEDRYGNSLDRELNVSFSTGRESVAPEIISFIPADGAVLEDPLTPVEITFSEAMDRESFYGAFSITPEIAGVFAWAAGDTGVSFAPISPYAPGADYAVRLESDATDTSGNRLLQPLVIGFRLPPEEELAAASVVRVSDGAPLLKETVVFLNPLAVEKDDTFRISFNRSVPLDRRPGIASLAPSVTGRLTWGDDGRSVLLIPGEEMSWMEVHELTVVDSRYRFRIAGEGSRPPGVVAAYFTPTLATGAFALLGLGDNVDFATSDDAAVEIIVSHSAESRLLFASAMEAVNLSVSRGAPIRFLVRDLELRDTHPQGGSLPPGRTAIRLHLSVEADTPGGGIVTLEVGTELTDSRGNSPREEWVLEVNGF